MKRLYVGCRVRILWSKGWPELAGQEGRIIGREETVAASGGFSEWAVAPDSWGSNIAPYPSLYGGLRFGPRTESLEPIIDPGHQVISWEEMADLWTPEKVGA